MRDIDDYERGIEYDNKPSHRTKEFDLYETTIQPSIEYTVFVLCTRDMEPRTLAEIVIDNEDGETIIGSDLSDLGRAVFYREDDDYIDLDITVSELLLQPTK